MGRGETIKASIVATELGSHEKKEKNCAVLQIGLAGSAAQSPSAPEVFVEKRSTLRLQRGVVDADIDNIGIELGG